MGNVHGRMTGLTLFTPIRPQWVWFLRIGLPLTRHLPFMARHILQFNFIKFVRWTIVPGLDDEQLNYEYLYFESNFDGPWQHYIDAFAYVIPLDIRVTWGRGPGFPAPPPAEPLKAWIAMNSMDGGTYYCAHADESTRMVNNALAVKERFDALDPSLPPDEFKAAWERFLTDAQAHL
ncbi:hypothetical protein OJ997_09260 [Solirubrobacter phytolaccae]|uniref:Uncharacterized protein n=1 Tax=Solirubrobacter phytolaccae TaxID=1404360 RepID=A0A9X3N8Q0_9ACTN|nr:hypothetical protein [Solirubrobacter phytolaccae]MDA0180480.1 hypothetical protein [Solirubrobacter phytolaccae]